MRNSLKSLLVVLLLAVFAVVGSIAWWQNRQIKRLTTEMAQLELERSRLMREEQAHARATAERERAEVEKRARAPVTSVANNTRPVMIAPNAVMDTPALQRALLNAMKEALDQRYARLYRKLKLAPGELEKLRDLLTEKQMSAFDVMREAQLQGLNPMKDGPEIAALMKKVQDELDDNIHTLLGEENFGTYQDFSRNIASYALLDRIDRRLSFSAPLQESQADALLQILLHTTQPLTAPDGPNNVVQTFVGPGGPVGAMGPPRITDETIAAAQAVLSAQQIEVLRRIQADQQSQAALTESNMLVMPAPPSDAAGNQSQR